MKSIQSLNTDTFQDFCSSFLIELFGIKVFPGGRGKDGGRDGIYNGSIQIPNTEGKLNGNWCIQVKFHNKDATAQSTWLRKPLNDLKGEYLKFKQKNHKFDSYLFITNVELTWVEETGTHDQIENKIKKDFEKIGFKNFIVLDGGRIRSILPFIKLTRQYFLSNNEKLGIGTINQCNKLVNSDLVLQFICDRINNGYFQLNKSHNPHFNSKISWLYKDIKFYLFDIFNHNEITYVLDCFNMTLSREIIVVEGDARLIRILKGKMKYLPVTKEDLHDSLIKYQQFIENTID